MISIADRILHHLELSLGIGLQQVVHVRLLGREYHLIKGTLRATPDYDDAWLLALGYEAQVVFDIGSNIGQAALLLLHPGKIKEIVLVDPNAMALSQAAQNLILNGCGELSRFVCAFAANQAAEMVDFYTVGTGAAGSLYASHAKTASTLKSKRSVPTTTIDNLVRMFESLPDLVKIDVEGAECLVLQGATELAHRQVTRFFVEMHSNAELPMSENAQKILDWCKEMNYQAWYLKEKIKLTTPQPIANRGRCHLLLLPAHQSLSQGLLNLEQGAPLEKVQLSRVYDNH